MPDELVENIHLSEHTVGCVQCLKDSRCLVLRAGEIGVHGVLAEGAYRAERN